MFLLRYVRCLYIQFRKSVAWLAMLNLQEPWSDHLTASSQSWPIVLSSMFHVPCFCLNKLRDHLQCHGWSLAITCYAIVSVHEPCEGSRHFIENGCTVVLTGLDNPEAVLSVQPHCTWHWLCRGLTEVHTNSTILVIFLLTSHQYIASGTPL